MIKIKISFPYPAWPVIRQTPANSGEWKGYKFFINENIEECDYWVVFNSLLSKREITKCNPNNTIFLTAEPNTNKNYPARFLNQFANIITSQREIKHRSVTYLHQGLPWFVNKSYDELMQTHFVGKKKQISIITSNKQFTDGHKKRYAFTMALKEYFGDAIDHYGRGIRNFEDKWEALAPYKYSIAIENSVGNDYLSEKLYDCYLAHTFPFYFGCPNVDQYFSDKSYLNIDINNLDSSKRIIENILNDTSHYERNLVYLIEAKKKYLDTYNLFPLITNFIESKLIKDKLPKENILLQQNFYDPYTLGTRIANKIKNTIAKIK